MRISEFQKLIEDIYYERDSTRGLAGTHMWFCEEVGELTRALRQRGVGLTLASMYTYKTTRQLAVKLVAW